MATTITAYNQLPELLATGLDLATGPVKMAMVTSSYTPDADHDAYADLGANVVSGMDAIALANSTVTQSSGTATWDADDIDISPTTATFRYGVLYLDDGGTKPLLARLLWDDTAGGTNIVLVSAGFYVKWHADGIMTLGV